jgi:hypothetical protein
VRAQLIVLGAMLAVAAFAAGSAHASSIAFIRAGNVWIAASDGSQPHALTIDGGTSPSISYSFVSASKAGTPLLGYRHANSIGVINPDGTGQRNVPPGHAPAVGPDTVLSANGQALVYISVAPGYGFYGDTVNIDGTSPAHIGASGVIDVSFGDPNGQTMIWVGKVHQELGTNSGPDCSVGGEEPFGLGMIVPELDSGSPEHHATGYFCVKGENVIEPRISPDGSTVLATLEAADKSTRIISFPRSELASPFTLGAPFTYVTPPGLNARNGDFSPDGTQIAFQGPSGVYTIPAGGGSPTLILGEATIPAWSPYVLPSAAGPSGPSPGPAPGGGGGGSVAHCKVPKVTGKTLAVAKRAIVRAGCRLGKVTKRSSSHRNRGRVIAESPKAGKSVAAGTKVSIFIGR